MLVSVYIPTKNRVASLATAVESILNQTYQNIEVIVVNDGSTDGTERYLADICVRDPRVRVINNSNPSGAPAARNRAINEARGYFVTGLDDDDHFLPERIAAFVAYWDLLQKNGAQPSCLYSQDLIIESEGKIRKTKKPGYVEYEDLFAHNCLGNQIFSTRANLIEVGLFDESLLAWQDLEFFMRVVKRFGPAHLLDMATQVFDDSPRPDRISQKSRAKIDSAFSQVVAKHASSNRRARQQLFLQIFSPYYGFRPRMADWVAFMRDGIWLAGMLKMARAMARKS